MDPTDIPFQQIIAALLDDDTVFNPGYLHRLSDLDSSELDQLKAIWTDITPSRRRALVEDVEELGTVDTLINFLPLALLAVKDQDPKVRLPAVRVMWEYEENILMPLLIDLIHNDSDQDVRSAAIAALGRFVFFGEIEEIPQKNLTEIEEDLLQMVKSDEPSQLRRTALEALGYSSRKEVPALIENAYESGETDWIASALFAMGRSYNEVWHPDVLAMLENNKPAIRCEAARAAGELEMSVAAPQLIEMLDDPDDDTRLASIWSLSQIGGPEVGEALEALIDQAYDDDELNLIEAALDNLAFNESLDLPLLDLSEPELDELYGISGNGSINGDLNHIQDNSEEGI